MNTIIIRRTFKQKAESIEQRAVTIADLAILIERLKEQLRDLPQGRKDGALVSELGYAKRAYKAAMERGAA